MTSPLLSWPDLTGRPRPEPDATLSYGPDTMHKVDVWVPAGDGPFPTVLMVHGGCWQTSIADRSLMNWIADDLRSHGIAVWNIDYRGVDRDGGGYPGTFIDVAKAADRLAVDAAAFGLDRSRLAAVGHSAGGHLALWLAGRHKLPARSLLAMPDPIRIDHAVSLGGLPDLELTAATPQNGCGVAVIDQLVGTGRRDRYADTSVPRLLPLGVPHDQINGDLDRIVPVALAHAYDAVARSAGDTVTLSVVARTGHVELIAPESAAWAIAKRRLIAALIQR